MAMNFSAIMPRPNISISRPMKISPKGNMYKIPVTHHTDTSQNNYEIWTTKEAVQKHFDGMTDTPREYQLRKFARQMYEKQMRSRRVPLEHKGILITSDNVSHGNPQLWPHTLSHPEVKI